MITLKLLKNTIIPAGAFFTQVTEAANRGCKLEWNEPDFTYAIQKLDTKEFLSDQTVIDIVNSGGEVTGYRYDITMSKDAFENTDIPQVLKDYLGIGEETEGEEVVTPKYKDVFTFVTPIYDTDTDGNVLDTFTNVKFINSTQGELLPMSITLQL